MTPPRSFVTIGAHHKGPHVDQLYALAERCGAAVIVLNADADTTPMEHRQRPGKRVPYAGYDPHQVHTQNYWLEAAL